METRKKKTTLIRIIIPLLLITLGCNSQHKSAHWKIWNETNIDSQGLTGQFDAKLYLIEDSSFCDTFNSPKEKLIIQRISKTQRLKPVFVIIIFGNPGANSLGLCDVTYDFTIKNPFGQIRVKRENINCWKNLPPPLQDEIQLNVKYTAVVLGDKDPDGTYTVEAIVYDNVKKIKLNLLPRTFVLN